MLPLPDSDIIKKAVAGDMYAFRQLVEKYQGFALALSRRFVENQDDAEDIVQEVFVRLWKNLPTYRHDIKLTTWLYKIVTNRCLDFLRSREGKKRRHKEPLERAALVAGLLTPEQELEDVELRRIVTELADRLTPKQKAVFILRNLEELDMQEIGEILSMSAGNVKSNLYYARVKMSELINQYYQEAATRARPGA